MPPYTPGECEARKNNKKKNDCNRLKYFHLSKRYELVLETYCGGEDNLMNEYIQSYRKEIKHLNKKRQIVTLIHLNNKAGKI